jgi:DNA-binding CsgD family transcriptional regulator
VRDICAVQHRRPWRCGSDRTRAACRTSPHPGVSQDEGRRGAPHERLSGRELEVFRLLASGKAVGEIAAILHLSVKTVSTYRSRVLEKTGFRSNAEIISYAIRAGLV